MSLIPGAGEDQRPGSGSGRASNPTTPAFCLFRPPAAWMGPPPLGRAIRLRLYRFQCSSDPATASQMRRDFCSAKYLVPAAQALPRNTDPHSKTVLSSIRALTAICKQLSSSQSPPWISALYVCAAFCFGPFASLQHALQKPASRAPAPEALASGAATRALGQLCCHFPGGAEFRPRVWLCPRH